MCLLGGDAFHGFVVRVLVGVIADNEGGWGESSSDLPRD
jgi:hypothetical protein